MGKFATNVTFLALMVGYSVAPVSRAGESESLDGASAEALGRTQELMKDPAARERFFKEDPAKAGRMDQDLDRMMGSDPSAKQEVYDLAADVFEDLVRQSGGDPMKMSEILEKAQRDPASFGKTLSPEQLERVKKLARDLEGKGKSPH